MKKQIAATLSLFMIVLGFQACSTEDASNVIAKGSPALSNSPETDGGHEHGNGGDDTRYMKAAWFPDSAKTVSYCVQVAEGFPVASDQVKDVITSSLTNWNETITQMKQYSTALLAKNYSLVENCASADLQFLFGTAISEEVRPKLGFVIRDRIEPTTLWSQGRIWVSSSGAKWNETFRLKGAILHLLGEVLGFDNVPGTILDSRWEQWLIENTSADLERKLTVIEHDRQLASVNGIFRGPVKMTAELQQRLGLSTASPNEMIEVDSSDMTLKVQSQKLRFVRLYMRQLKNGDLHKVVYYDKTGFYSWMRKIPKLLRTENYTIVCVIQFIDLPGRPQVILELNGDQAVKLSPL